MASVILNTLGQIVLNAAVLELGTAAIGTKILGGAVEVIAIEGTTFVAKVKVRKESYTLTVTHDNPGASLVG